MAEYTFRVDLTHDGNTFQNPDEVLAIANTKTMYLPVGSGVNPNKKLVHGQTFVVSGVNGYRLKSLIEQQRITNVVLHTSAIEEEEEENPIYNLLGVSEEGIYSMRFEGDLYIGGRVYLWDEMDLPGGSWDTIGNPVVATDGTNVFALFTSENDGSSSLLKVEPDETVTVIDTSELPASDLSYPESMTYVGDNKLAVISNNKYILFTTSGEFLLSLEQFSYQGFNDIIYFENELYGFGDGNVLVTINKDTGELLHNEDMEQKLSRTLSWKSGSLEYDISAMYEPFVAGGRLFARAYPNNVDNYVERLVEVFPDTNEIFHICFFDVDIDFIVECEFEEDRSLETGFSIPEFDPDRYEFEAWFYNGEIWVDEPIFPIEPTLENLIFQWGNNQELLDGNDPGWQSLTITAINFDEDEKEWTINYTDPEPGYTMVMRMRYVDGSGDYWTYIRED